MGRRKGVLTVADILGGVVVFFIFAVMSGAMFDAVAAAWKSSGPLTSVLFAIIPAVILIGFLKGIWELAATRFVRRQQQSRRVTGSSAERFNRDLDRGGRR